MYVSTIPLNIVNPHGNISVLYRNICFIGKYPLLIYSREATPGTLQEYFS